MDKFLKKEERIFGGVPEENRRENSKVAHEKKKV